MNVLKSYIHTCLKEVPEKDRQAWIENSIVLNQIEDDLENPKYKNFAK